MRVPRTQQDDGSKMTIIRIGRLHVNTDVCTDIYMAQPETKVTTANDTGSGRTEKEHSHLTMINDNEYKWHSEAGL